MTDRMDGQRFTAQGLGAAILDSTHALVVTLDIEGRITGFNRACEMLTGYEAQEVIGTHIWDRLLPAEIIEPVKKFFADLPADGAMPDEFEATWITRDGRQPIIAWNNSVLRNATGEIELVVGIGVDITERKTAADRLARAQRIAGIGSWEWDIAADRHYWSEQAFLNLGLEPDSATPSLELFLERVHPDDRPGLERQISLAIQRTESYKADYRVIWPDGAERQIHAEADALADDDGKLVSLAGTMQDVTELRESENRLTRITKSFANAQRIARTGNWDWDATTKIEWWSDEVYRMMGLKPGAVEPSFDSFIQFVHPGDRQKVRRAIRVAQDNLASYEVSFRIRRSDGEERVIHETGESILDAQGRLAGLSGTIQDITERHAAEQALTSTASRLKAATRLARLGNWEWNPETNELAMSEETLRICGLDPEHAVVDNSFLMAMIPTEQREHVIDIMNCAISGAEPYTNQYQIVRPNGDVRTVFEHGEPKRDETSGKTRLVGTIQDITEQKRTERALRESEARLRGIFENAPVGIGLADLRGHLIQVNRQFADFLAYKPDELVGLTYRDYTHPDHMDAAGDQIDGLIAGTASRAAQERKFIRSNGTTVWGNRTLSVIRDDDGNPNFIVIAVKNIDDRKKAERDLVSATNRLKEAQRIAHIGNWEWQPGNRDTVWSEEMFRIFGLEPGTIHTTRDSFFDRVHADDRESVAEAMARTIETGESYETEFRIWRHDGAVRHVFERGERYFDVATGEASVRGVMQDVTERKRAELALRETKQRLEEAQKLAHVGHWEWNPVTNSSTWSDEVYRIFGLPPASVDQEQTHESFMALVHQKDGDVIERIMAATLETGEPYDIEFRIVRPNGEIRTIFERAERQTSEEESGYLIRGVLQDITERKAFEEELRETAERLEKSQSAGKVGTWVWEMEEDREWWSDEIYRLYGMEVGEVVLSGFGFLDYVHAEDREETRAALNRSIREGKPYAAEYRIRRVDGHEVILSEYGEIEFDSEGKPLRMHGTAQDITERKRAEIALQQAMERLKEAQSLGQMGSYAWYPDEDVVWWSDELYRIFGLEPGSETMTEWSFLEYMHPDDRDQVRKIEIQAIQAEIPYAVEYRALRPDGTERTVYEQAEWIEKDSSGRPHWRGIVQDITERKRIEDELARLNCELEQRVEERTAALRTAQEELVKNERLATLGQLTATVSHELRNPLGAMRTSMYVVEKKLNADDQGLRAAIERVNRNITRCDQIIDELLDFTRIRDLELDETEVDDWLGTILDEQNIPQGVTVERNFAAPGVTVPVDTNRLRRAFVNVFENACQAAAGQHAEEDIHIAPCVNVETRLLDGQVEITVSDNGPGVPPEMRERVFEPLFSTKSFGVGLGLPTVRQILEQHGGKVKIRDGREGGAVFALLVPLGSEVERAEA